MRINTSVNHCQRDHLSTIPWPCYHLALHLDPSSLATFCTRTRNILVVVVKMHQLLCAAEQQR